MDNENSKLKLIDKNGEEKLYDVLCAFYLDKTDKYYIVYTDNAKDEDDKILRYASIFDPNDDTKLEMIKTEEEWNAVEKAIEEITKNANINA